MKLLKLILTFSLTIILFVLNSGCEKTTENNDTSTDITTTLAQNNITKKDVEALDYEEYVFDDDVIEIISDWDEFSEIQLQIENLKSASLFFFKDDDSYNTLNILFSDLKDETPTLLYSNQISVRLLILETTFFKLEDLVNYNYSKEDILNIIKEIFIAHSNLIFQINKKVEDDRINIIKPI